MYQEYKLNKLKPC